MGTQKLSATAARDKAARDKVYAMTPDRKGSRLRPQETGFCI